MCFPVNFAKFLRTPFLIEHLRWLLLNNELWCRSESIVQFLGELTGFFVKVRTNENVTLFLQSDR